MPVTDPRAEAHQLRANRRVITTRLRFDGVQWWTNLAFLSGGVCGLVTGITIQEGTE